MTIIYCIVLASVFAFIGILFYARNTMSLPIEVIDHIHPEPKKEMTVPTVEEYLEAIDVAIKSNVSDEEIEAVFKNTNFGPGNHRERLTKSVLKVAVGCYCGNTITCIMRSLGLIGQHRQGRLPVLTKKGQEYLQTALYKQL